ncbi:hypothetical protein HXZ66_10820 [Bacillus sp. A116_S68]|nr:hypothetical protein HXZ66_10820 [Bacillus sp. A116_S68]
MSELCIIPCGNKKIWSKHPNLEAVPASDAYISTFHRLCRAYAERFFTQYVILSAKHGFLFAEDHVPGPYNVSFSMKSSEVISTDTLRKQFENKRLHNYDHYIVLTGKKYVPVINHVMNDENNVEFPLLDFQGIGFMQQALKHALETDEPLHGKKIKNR